MAQFVIVAAGSNVAATLECLRRLRVFLFVP
jgi:hypothetical protein